MGMVTKKTLRLAAKQILMSAYLYYVRDTNVISDDENDKLCRYLSENWEYVPMRYKPLLDPDGVGRDCVLATTSHCKYTRLVEGGALAWLEKETGTKLERIHEGYYEIPKNT